MNSNEIQKVESTTTNLTPSSSPLSTLKMVDSSQQFNPLNNIYEQLLQRNIALFNHHQQQNMLANNYHNLIQPTSLSNNNNKLQCGLALEYQLRYRSIINAAQNQIASYLPYQSRASVIPIENNHTNGEVADENGYNNTQFVSHAVTKTDENIRSIVSEGPKPTHSYIGLIAMAILSTPDKKLVLSDIYQWIQDNYLYFRTRGPGWRNSIRHNLSLNDCFIKCGRSANGKGHYWTIHPANLDDFSRGDFRRRRAQRRVRKSLGLMVPEEEDEEDDEVYEEYDDELITSSTSSVSPVQKIDNNNNNIQITSQLRKRNYDSSNAETESVPEKRYLLIMKP